MSHSSTNQPKYRTVIADDHPLILMGLERALTRTGLINLVAKCSDGLTAYEAILNHQPDMAILDIQMPELNGLEIAERLQHEEIKTKIVLLTMFHDLSMFEKAKQLNVNGYLLKDSMLDEIGICTQRIMLGEDYLSKSMETINAKLDNKTGVLDKLSRMEKKVFQLIAERKSSKEIAELLFLSPKTIDNHRYNICKKLNIVGGTNALLMYALDFNNS